MINLQLLLELTELVKALTETYSYDFEVEGNGNHEGFVVDFAPFHGSMFGRIRFQLSDGRAFVDWDSMEVSMIFPETEFDARKWHKMLAPIFRRGIAEHQRKVKETLDSLVKEEEEKPIF